MAINTIMSLLENKEFIEFARLGVVYMHLLACCVALGLVLTSDIAMVRDLLKRKTFTEHDNAHMESLQKSVVFALIGLWVTGAAIIGIDYLEKGTQYFMNPKLQAKVIIVLLLTYNGMLLHSKVLPALQKAGSLLKLEFSARMLALFCGSLSAVSWMYAAMLGVGRPLAWKYSLSELLMAYPVLIVLGFLVMLALTQRANQQSSTAMPGQTLAGAC
ncbi:MULTISPECIES: hypothetical protein [Pseudomonas]|uniref:hypothetical protein n=1 Tax=Pseudomonas TaxID=286 RepID=UPI00047F5CF1|nr:MULTISPECIES: hypothetical protein [Pseudomonas]PRA52339.1 hypothetical protein CQZ98_17335 [Pseudomonas sp. MYb115]QXN48359.1 hypothetical protein KW062_18890 [Pseudomonas fluorescens]WSO22668.1 hypothetical protein VUJ50_19030 [Pseudomonas fluorescens]